LKRLAIVMAGGARNRRLATTMLGVVLGAVPSFAQAQAVANGPNLNAVYEVVGRMHNIDAGLLQAIAQVESGGNPYSVSPKGALGIMQLMPGTASEFAVMDPFDPVSNVLGAADFLDYLRNRLGAGPNLQGLPDLLAAYNAGPAAVEKYGGMPPYKETRQYVQKVIERYTNGSSTGPGPAAYMIRRSSPYSFHPQPVLITGDGDGSVLNQLAAIQRLRARLVASMSRGAGPLARQVVRQSSGQLP
jgi:hypothetical protein